MSIHPTLVWESSYKVNSPQTWHLEPVKLDQDVCQKNSRDIPSCPGILCSATLRVSGLLHQGIRREKCHKKKSPACGLWLLQNLSAPQRSSELDVFPFRPYFIDRLSPAAESFVTPCTILE